MAPLTRMKKNLIKKNRNESMDEGVGKRADEEERKKNAIRTLRATRKEKKEKENERNKEKEKKRLKRKKSTKVGIHIPHPLHSNIRTKKNFFRLRISKM